jgi:hypothetical protein
MFSNTLSFLSSHNNLQKSQYFYSSAWNELMSVGHCWDDTDGRKSNWTKPIPEPLCPPHMWLPSSLW